MYFLSLSQPWAWSIFDPIANKGVENRRWPPPVEAIGQRIALQASGSWDKRAIGIFNARGITTLPARYDQFAKGVIVGVATIDRVVTVDRTLPPDQKRWLLGGEFGEYGWVLTDRIALPQPPRSPGALGLRILSTEVTVEVIRQLEEMGKV